MSLDISRCVDFWIGMLLFVWGWARILRTITAYHSDVNFSWVINFGIREVQDGHIFVVQKDANRGACLFPGGL